jgi:hypothetical protein
MMQHMENLVTHRAKASYIGDSEDEGVVSYDVSSIFSLDLL